LEGAAFSAAFSAPSIALASSLVLTNTLMSLMVEAFSNKKALFYEMQSCSSNGDSSFKASSFPASFAIFN